MMRTLDFLKSNELVIESSPDSSYVKTNIKLGTGGFKAVNKGYDVRSKREIAWNELKSPGSIQKIDTLIKEINLLQSLKHPNILSFFDWWHQENNVTINGTLKIEALSSPQSSSTPLNDVNNDHGGILQRQESEHHNNNNASDSPIMMNGSFSSTATSSSRLPNNQHFFGDSRFSSSVDIHIQQSNPTSSSLVSNHFPTTSFFRPSTSGQSQVVFVTELMSGGTLKEYLRRNDWITPRTIRDWASQVLSGLQYLHSHEPRVIHRDLKCDNIFINFESNEIKIGDMGLATIKGKGFAETVIGTPAFMAPEMYEEFYSEAVDIYAFGMCLLEMFTGEYPYEKECTNPAQIFKKVTQGLKPQSLELVINTYAQTLISNCINHDPEERWSLEQIMQSDFFTKDPTSPETLEGSSSITNLATATTLTSTMAASMPSTSRGGASLTGLSPISEHGHNPSTHGQSLIRNDEDEDVESDQRQAAGADVALGLQSHPKQQQQQQHQQQQPGAADVEDQDFLSQAPGALTSIGNNSPPNQKFTQQSTSQTLLQHQDPLRSEMDDGRSSPALLPQQRSMTLQKTHSGPANLLLETPLSVHQDLDLRIYYKHDYSMDDIDPKGLYIHNTTSHPVLGSSLLLQFQVKKAPVHEGLLSDVGIFGVIDDHTIQLTFTNNVRVPCSTQNSSDPSAVTSTEFEIKKKVIKFYFDLDIDTPIEIVNEMATTNLVLEKDLHRVLQGIERIVYNEDWIQFLEYQFNLKKDYKEKLKQDRCKFWQQMIANKSSVNSKNSLMASKNIYRNYANQQEHPYHQTHPYHHHHHQQQQQQQQQSRDTFIKPSYESSQPDQHRHPSQHVPHPLQQQQSSLYGNQIPTGLPLHMQHELAQAVQSPSSEHSAISDSIFEPIYDPAGAPMIDAEPEEHNEKSKSVQFDDPVVLPATPVPTASFNLICLEPDTDVAGNPLSESLQPNSSTASGSAMQSHLTTIFPHEYAPHLNFSMNTNEPQASHMMSSHSHIIPVAPTYTDLSSPHAASSAGEPPAHLNSLLISEDLSSPALASGDDGLHTSFGTEETPSFNPFAAALPIAAEITRDPSAIDDPPFASNHSALSPSYAP